MRRFPSRRSDRHWLSVPHCFPECHECSLTIVAPNRTLCQRSSLRKRHSHLSHRAPHYPNLFGTIRENVNPDAFRSLPRSMLRIVQSTESPDQLAAVRTTTAPHASSGFADTKMNRLTPSTFCFPLRRLFNCRRIRRPTCRIAHKLK